MADTTRPRLFEASWEVCNKVGGIHTVITSKLAEAQAEFGDGYVTVGPYLPTSGSAFLEAAVPDSLSAVAARLAEQGVGFRYGIWEPYGQPTVLLGWEGLLPRLNDYKAAYWERYGLSTLGSDFYDFDQPFVWGIAVGLLARAAAETSGRPVILHAHEWLSASSILELGTTDIRTVFTTHATALGRALSATGTDLCGDLSRLDPETEAAAHNVLPKHQLERIAAGLASSFTTVSRLTAQEATALLGTVPAVVTENGLDLDAFPTFDGLAAGRLAVRQAVDEFLAAYFFPSGPFDLSTASVHFTMGRPETRNKGYDMHLEALGLLNERLKRDGSDRTVVTFFLVPAGCLRLRAATASQITLYRRLREKLARIGYEGQRQAFADLCASQPPRPLLTPGQEADIRADIARMPLPVSPPLSPYELADESRDDILRLAAEHGLLNRPEDRVKTLYFPLYLDGFDGIFDLPLYDLIQAFDLGVFPSRYEPWGYTPMESLAVGVPAVTSTLAGFGRSIAESGRTRPTGVLILDREKAEDDAVELLTGMLRLSLTETPRQWAERRISAYQTAQLFSWKHLYQNYRQAYSR